MTGTETDAALAYQQPYEFLLSTDGSTRAVYLINGVVYKVPYHGEQYFNNLEAERAAEYRERLELLGVRVPNVTLYPNGVLAMDWVPGTRTGTCCGDDECMDAECLDECEEDIVLSSGLEDTAYGNLMWHEGELWVIDLG